MSALCGFLPASVWGWVILAIIMIVIELISMGLTTIWAAGGAFAAAIVSFVTDNILLQCFCFAVVTLILLIATRPLALKKVNQRAVQTNVNALINQKTIAETDISAIERGTVKIDGKIWTAIPAADSELIHKGDIVIITGVKGVTLIVEKEGE